MNTLQLNHILNSSGITKRDFYGVLARDQLPEYIPYPKHFIVNTEESSEPGEHWLAFYYDKNGICNFFDSYGNSPKLFNLEDYILKTSNGYKFNSFKVQENSKFCGIYCVCFIYFMSHGFNMGQIVEKFKQIDNADAYFTKFFN